MEFTYIGNQDKKDVRLAGSFANGAFVTANSAASFANAAFDRANAAFLQANTSGGGGSSTPVTIYSDVFTANGATTTFNLSTTPTSENYIIAVVDGITQLRSTYTVTGNVVTFDSTFESGANVEITTITGGGSDPYAANTANAAYATANAAFLQANNSTDTWVRTQANNAYDKANSGATFANGAFSQSNNASSFANGAFDRANSGYGVANTGSSFANGAFVTANSAASFANSSFETANAAASFANGAFLRANSGYGVANSGASFANGAFTQANTAVDLGTAAFIQANAAFLQANNSTDTWVRTQANSAFNAANSSGSFANGAFDRANAAYAQANTGSTDAYARSTANAAFVTANLAYNVVFNSSNTASLYYITRNFTGDGNTNTFSISSNTSANSILVFDNGITQNPLADYSVTGNTITFVDAPANGTIIQVRELLSNIPLITDNSNFAFDRANSAYATANAAFLQANNSTDTWVRTQANNAYDTANSAASFANGAFVTANSGALFANASFITANSAGDFANAAFITANSSATFANASFITANASYVAQNTTAAVANGAFVTANSGASFANAAFTTANSAASFANGAFATANLKFNTSGGTISGDVSITGNLSVLGNAFSTSATQIVANDTLFIMGTGNYSGDVLDIGFSSHYNDGTNAHTGIIRDAGTKEWHVFEGYTPEVGANNNIDINHASFKIATLQANLKSTTITIKGIDLLPYVNNAYATANSGASVANGAFVTANSGASFANSAFITANSSYASQNTTAAFANGAFVTANASYNSQNTTAAFANGAFVTANAAFNAANNATDPWVRNQANNAYNTANAAFTAANSAGGADTWARAQANAAYNKANTSSSGTLTGYVDAFTGDGSNSAFTLSTTPSDENIIFVSIQGVMQPKTSYSLSGNILTFDSVPPNTAYIEVTTLSGTNISSSSLMYRTYTGDNTATNFAVTSGVNVNNLLVAENGILQRPTTDYTVSGANVVFTTAPATGVDIQVRELVTVSAGNSLTWYIANANTTMVASSGYFVDTSTGPKTMTLPASATLGDTIRLNDLAGTFSANNLTVARNSHKIQGIASDLLVDIDQTSFGLVYSNTTYGWKVLEL
jgi:hypothetical protein